MKVNGYAHNENILHKFFYIDFINICYGTVIFHSILFQFPLPALLFDPDSLIVIDVKKVCLLTNTNSIIVNSVNLKRREFSGKNHLVLMIFLIPFL